MIKIEKLNKKFGEKRVIKDFSYEIPDGIMIAITGKSGCGKSTLLNILGLLDVDYDGKISVLDATAIQLKLAKYDSF